MHLPALLLILTESYDFNAAFGMGFVRIFSRLIRDLKALLTKMNQVELDIHLTSEEFMGYYEGKVKSVFAYTDSGQSIQFPAAILRPFLEHSGIQGRFRITFDTNGKLQGVQQVL